MASNRNRLIVKTAAATLGSAAVAAAAGGWLFLESGLFHVGATNQHWQWAHTVLERGMRKSVQYHARDVVTPALAGEQRLLRGAAIYRDNCVQCHGGPGVAQADIAKAMQPVPGPLVDAARHWKARELYWITRHGIKTSGMPAWQFHLADDDIWSVVAFMQTLPALSAPRFKAALAPLPPAPKRVAPIMGPANADRGRVALTQYACNACHIIPGVTGSRVYVGRPLTDLGKRKFIAGHVPNTQENLMRWIMDPQSIDPHTAMPKQGVTAQDALDISAYLLTKT
ncbi:c-type cytochrome [Massilia sp. PAMC28688]|uniref:c-type cytochrome n=1 Tax=Massilia sp. PAMC28688 TaxID=2861283 RepID=UPI001C626F98|nr:c-type cytochrome [Massilia sp. PAMC28688]QYF95794.1 c-type cytochrome [Massilia sp. PAMC28688]